MRFHPQYDQTEWQKWRSAYDGGKSFKDTYLYQLSTREDSRDFAFRKKISYSPSHAKSAIIEIRNSIFERLVDIVRIGGTESYKRACAGKDSGVDRQGSSMMRFIGTRVLTDLLVMGKVGVFVDRPIIEASDTYATTRGKSPYLYLYAREDILSWDTADDGTLDTVLLRNISMDVDEFGLPTDEIESYILLQRLEGQVQYTKFGLDGVTVEQQYMLNLPKLPFVIFEMDQSLMTDVADIQIALLNVASTDMIYTVKANFPFYTEQTSPQADYLARPSAPRIVDGVAQPPTAANAQTAADNEIALGPTNGRAYPKGLERPGFIHPSSEPLQASMAKQEAMKQEIRQILQLALTNIKPQRASADSKEKDNQSLEAGLSNIGMELEHGERQIAELWSLYEGSQEDITINYPDQYSLRSDEDRQAESMKLLDLLPKVPSLTFQKEIAKRVADLTIGAKLSTEQLATIYKEIDAATVIVTDPDIIKTDHEAGLVSTETASRARLYPKGEVDQAKNDHAERLARISAAQTTPDAGARGLADQSGDKNAAKNEKTVSQAADTQDDGKKAVRGAEK